jgi:pimeloyl-ACP methyl ester carboxylesterase
MKRYSRGYWLRLSVFFVGTLIIAILGLPILLGALFTVGLVYAPCTDNNATLADYGLSGEAVTVPARAGGSFRGYFIPGTNGATIIMPPAYTSGRNGRLVEAAFLARRGYTLFLFESRRCAGMGPLSLGYLEVNEVADVLAYLSARPQRIGIYGFSSAGATSVMAAARFPQICAVVAEGGYGDFLENTLGQDTGSGLRAYFGSFLQNALGQDIGSGLSVYFLTLYRWGSKLTYRLLIGLDMSRLSPASVIGQIAPRPILLIYGSRETSLPGGYQQKEAAGDNAELWIVEGAGHGSYLAAAPAAYEARITAFFDKALLEESLDNETCGE